MNRRLRQFVRTVFSRAKRPAAPPGFQTGMTRTKEDFMHILALNSSPRDHETSKTELVLQKFLEGAKRAGASTETLYLQEL